MTDTLWLADKSALVRLGHAVEIEEWTTRVQRGLVRVSTPTLLEVGYSSESADDWKANQTGPPLTLMPVEHLTPRVEERALQVQGLLAHLGRHRAPSVPDLLIAAIAETVGLTVLHVDKDFELIAEITGQPVERLRVRG